MINDREQEPSDPPLTRPRTARLESETQKLADMGGGHRGGRVSDSDAEIFHIFGATRNCDCRWRILVDWSSRGRKGTATIDNNGRPFRTVGIKDLPGYEVADGPSGTYRWKRRPPAPDPFPLR
ncbi:hypothetical protein ABZU75_04685 [Streptosporangium sp. NPDC005286]|uniref:hypothetical protein n=1 Tax=Streptosporangium sp. NPDC005286 TaxID=3154463 RepID=UPI0033AD0B59